MSADSIAPYSPARRFLISFFGALLIWVLMTGSLSGAELGAGVVVALIVTLITWPYLALYDSLLITPLMPLHLLHYLLLFMRSLILANFDMAARVISPNLPINPEFVTIETAIKSRLGRLLLANSITLTPGTLTVDVMANGTLLIHWIDVTPGTDMETATAEIAAEFETIIRKFLR